MNIRTYDDIINIINKFIIQQDYLKNEHVIGIIFYGSYQTGMQTDISDIDIRIIFDDTDLNHIYRGKTVIDGITIEYHEEPLTESYTIIEEDYTNQNKASLAIYGNSVIKYDKFGDIQKLKQHTLETFSNPLPDLDSEQKQLYLAILSNRMKHLEEYAKEDNPYFHHLYHLTLNKIRTYYHKFEALSRVELSKALRIYDKPEYIKAISLEKIPEKEFSAQYFYAITNQELTTAKKYEAIKKLYNIAIKGLDFDEQNHRFRIESRNIGFECEVTPPQIITMTPQEIPKNVSEIITKFIKNQDYLNNKHCLGIIVYGSSIREGQAKATSDIDVQIVFDNEDPNHIFRGAMTIDGKKIEYFEEPINEIYLSIENDFLNNQNIAWLSIIGMGKIVFERYGYLRQLQQYAINRFKEPLIPLSENDKKEAKFNLEIKLQKLQKFAQEDSHFFETYRQYVLSIIRKTYHKTKGITKIATSKVPREYLDKNYRESMGHDIPEQEFVDTFLELIKPNKNKDKLTLYKEVEDLYNYTTQTINLGTNFKIPIKSRRDKLSKSNKLNTLIRKRVN